MDMMGLLDDDKSVTPPLTQAMLEELRVKTPHCVAEDVATIKDTATPEFIEDFNKYLHEFAKPGDDPGMPCLRCGYALSQTMVEQLIGKRGGFTWGLVHGHGHCKECYWPVVAHHYIKDRNDKEMLTVRNLMLQIHPDNLELPPKKEKDGKEN